MQLTFSAILVNSKYAAGTMALALILALSPLSMSNAMHHAGGDTDGNGNGEGKTAAKAQIALAEQMIDAFYSFDAQQLAPLLTQAPDSATRILYYQGWAKGGNYIVLNRAPCAVEDANKIACAITVQDDPVQALKTGFDVTDTFHLTFEGTTIVAVDTSSNDEPIYFEARKWVEANRPEVMTGPCKDRNAGGTTPVACAQAMTQGYKAFYEAVVAPRSQ